MIGFLIKFWPFFVPLVLFVLRKIFISKRKKSDFVEVYEVSNLETKLWNWVLLSTLIGAVAALLWVAIGAQSNVDSRYITPKYENGKIIPGKMVDE